MERAAGYSIDQMHVIEGELASGERIRWTGRPHSWRFVPAMIPRFIFGIFVAAAALPILVDALGAEGWGGRLFLSVFALPFVLVALVLLSALPWAIRKGRRTLYVVTDRRAITFLRGISSTSIRSFGPEQLTDLERKEKDDGSGDITFMSVVKALGRGEPDARRASAEGLGFFGIEDVREVEELLKDIAAHADVRGESPYTERETD